MSDTEEWEQGDVVHASGPGPEGWMHERALPSRPYIHSVMMARSKEIKEGRMGDGASHGDDATEQRERLRAERQAERDNKLSRVRELSTELLDVNDKIREAHDLIKECEKRKHEIEEALLGMMK